MSSKILDLHSEVKNGITEIIKVGEDSMLSKSKVFPGNEIVSAKSENFYCTIRNAFQDKNEDWYFINRVRVLLKTWLEEEKKFNLNESHKKLFKNSNPDYVLINKNYGLFFLIDYKNDKKYKNSQNFFNKAVCEVNNFMTLVTLINSDYKRLPFYIVVHLPPENDIKIEEEKNCFIFTNGSLRSLIEFIESKSVNEVKETFVDLMKFLVGLNEKYNPMSLIKEKAQIPINKKIKVFPELFPLTTSESKNKKGSTAKVDEASERKLYDALKQLINKENNGEWYLIYKIDKIMKTWLETLEINGFYEYLLKIAKKEANCEHGFDSDFILLNKKNGIFLIDSKNVKAGNENKAIGKAIDQGKVFMHFLSILNPDYLKLSFNFGVYIPNYNSKANELILNDIDLKNLGQLESKLTSKLQNVNEVKDTFDDLIKFLVGLKTTFEPEMVLNATNKIDENLKQFISHIVAIKSSTNKTPEIDKNKSLIGKKVLISGPAGSGKTYIIRNNIIDALTPPKRIGLVVSDDEELYSKTIVEVDGEIKLCKYLEKIEQLSSKKWEKLKIFIFHKNTKCFYLLEAESYKSIEGYKFKKVITYNLFCSEFVISVLEILNAIEEDCGIDYIFERNEDKAMMESKIQRKNKTVNISGNSHIKEKMENDYGNMIIFFVCEESRNNFKDILCDGLFSGIDIIEILNISSIVDEFHPNSISLCFACSFATNLIKEEINNKNKKNTLWKSIKYYYPCDYNEFDLVKLIEISFVCVQFDSNSQQSHILLTGKTRYNNEYVYDLFLNFLEFAVFLKKLSEFNKITINFFDYSNNKDLREVLFKRDLMLKINYSNEVKNSIIESFYKHSLFFIGPCYFSATLWRFQYLFAFRLAKRIHIFVDDIMSSIIYPVRRIELVPKYEQLENKIKTFLVTFDANQFVYYQNKIFIPFFDIEFSILNLNTIYRCSQSVFNYLLPFYEYSHYSKYIEEDISHYFISLKEFRNYILEDLTRLKKKVHDQEKNEKRKSSTKFCDQIIDIIKSIPLESIKCGNNADGEVKEIEVESNNLLKTVKEFIGRAIQKKISKENIAIFIHHSYSISKDQKKIEIEYFEEPVAYHIRKYRNHKNADIFIKNPYTLNLRNKLNEECSKFCQIFSFSDLNEFVGDENATNLYSTEFNYVICVFPDGFVIQGLGRLESYFTFSRATMNLIIISVKEEEYILLQSKYQVSSIIKYHQSYQNIYSSSRLNTFENSENYSEKSGNLAKQGSFFSDFRVLCISCERFKNSIYPTVENDTEFFTDYTINLENEKKILYEQNIERLCEELRSLEIRTSDNLEIFNESSDYRIDNDLLENFIAISFEATTDSLFESVRLLVNDNEVNFTKIFKVTLFLMFEFEEYFKKIIQKYSNCDRFETIVCHKKGSSNIIIKLALSILFNRPLCIYKFNLDSTVSTELYCVHESQLNTKALNLAFKDNQFIPLIPKSKHLSSIDKDQLNKDFLIDTIKHPYKTIESRIKSFENWPINYLNSVNLAEAGFFCSGKTDAVICYYCGVCIYNWEPSDEPFTEHARRSPNCSFIRNVKGENFISEVIVKYENMKQ